MTEARLRDALDRANLHGTRRGIAASMCDLFPREDPAEVIRAVLDVLGRKDVSLVKYPGAYARSLRPDVARLLRELDRF
jgi:hypothetical protein